MRKDLKIGLAIGAVLLVVLIVYLAVPKGGGDNEQIAQGGGAGDGSAAVTPETTGAGDTTGATGSDAKSHDVSKDVEQKDKADKAHDIFGGTAGTGDQKDKVADSSSADNDVWARALEKGELPSQTVTPTSSTPPSLIAVTREKQEKSAEPKSAEPKTAEPETTTPIKATAGGDLPPAVDPPSEPAKKQVDKVEVGNGGGGATPRTHKVQRGEDYSKIAKMVYGDAKYYIQIEEANPGIEPTKLKPGMEIKLPELAASKEKEKTTGSSTATASKSDKKLADDEYRVQPGDSLYKIAMKRYGSSNMVDAIYQANKQTIGSDSSKLKQDMVLKMPANPSETSR
jgi:nucleoid-associated protein YgaU